MKEEFDTPRLHGLDDTVPAFDADGNHYTRKIRTGLKRGEFYVTRDNNDNTPLVVQKVQPTHLNLYDTKNHKPVRHPVNPELRLCWMLTEAAYEEALRLGTR